MAKLEKGLSEVIYTTKAGTVKKYRVRITTQEFKFNKLFDTLELAQEALALSKTIAGRNILTNAINGIEEKKAFYAEILSSEALKVHLPIYFEQHLKKPELEEKDVFSNETYGYKLKALLETKIDDLQVNDKLMGGMIESLSPIMRASFKPRKKPLGDFSVFQITQREILFYINARLELGRKKSTIKRELALLSGFFTRISLFGKKYEHIENPVSLCLKKTNKLDGTFIKRDRRLEDGEEEKLYKALSSMRNPDMLKIVLLAHYTGMRRSEILGLKWSQLAHAYKQENPARSFIQIYKGKNQEPRKVKVFSEAQAVIDSLTQKPNAERVFTYTFSGFNANIRRAIKKAGLADYRFHDLRAELISKLFEAGFNSVIVASVANIDNQTYFDRTHKRNHEEREMIASSTLNDEQIRRTAGHNNKQAQRGYVRLSDNVLSKLNQLPKRSK